MQDDSTKYRIAKLIYKSIANIINADDKITLENWLKLDDNKTLYNNIIDKNNIQNKYELFNNIDADKVYRRLEAQILKDQEVIIPLYRKPWLKYAAAASILLISTLTVFLNKDDNTPEFTEPIIVNNQIETGTDGAILTLESGEEVALEKGTSYQTQNAISNGEEIVYSNASSKEIAYNTLTVARGNQFFINLSDGTKVWLNSESQIKYPISFNDGETRQIDLVYGEAYFDVSPSIDHKGADFKVYHKEQEVQVLGTEFNIKAYKDEINIYTTLAEGKVTVNTPNTNQILAPNQQSNLNIENGDITIIKVDVSIETAWKDGVFNFNNMPLKNIMKILSRWYDMDVVFENKELETKVLTGSFKKKYSIEEILLTINNTNTINGYEINNNILTIK